MAGGLTAAPERVEPKRGRRLKLKCKYVLIRGDLNGGMGGGTEHGVLFTWPRLRGGNVVRTAMPADIAENHGLFGVVHDTGEKAPDLELHRLSAIDDLVERLQARGQNEAAWAAYSLEHTSSEVLDKAAWDRLVLNR